VKEMLRDLISIPLIIGLSLFLMAYSAVIYVVERLGVEV
jgi:hypothetical protein